MLLMFITAKKTQLKSIVTPRGIMSWHHTEDDANKMHGYLKKHGYKHAGVDSVWDD